MNLIKGIDESKLILRLSEGDKTAFEILFRHYYPGLVIYASKFVQDRSEAEEIVQEFFIRLWEKHHKIKSSPTLKSYVFQSVKNSSLNFIRDKKVSLPIIEELVQRSGTELIFNPDLYVASELQQKIERAVNNLPERCREVFLMSRFRNMKNDEIAQELNISKRTVETHISNAIKVLKTELKDFLMLLIMFKLG